MLLVSAGSLLAEKKYLLLRDLLGGVQSSASAAQSPHPGVACWRTAYKSPWQTPRLDLQCFWRCDGMSFCCVLAYLPAQDLVIWLETLGKWPENGWLWAKRFLMAPLLEHMKRARWWWIYWLTLRHACRMKHLAMHEILWLPGRGHLGGYHFKEEKQWRSLQKIVSLKLMLCFLSKDQIFWTSAIFMKSILVSSCFFLRSLRTFKEMCGRAWRLKILFYRLKLYN